MSQPIEPGALAGRWMHSHEEDTPTEKVYRPAGFQFPPSRGRDSFELQPDGTLVLSTIGPADRSETEAATWAVEEGDRLAFYTGAQLAPSRVLQVAAVEPDRLIFRK